MFVCLFTLNCSLNGCAASVEVYRAWFLLEGDFIVGRWILEAALIGAVKPNAGT